MQVGDTTVPILTLANPEQASESWLYSVAEALERYRQRRLEVEVIYTQQSLRYKDALQQVVILCHDVQSGLAVLQGGAGVF
jgi:hypothetical protein